MGDFVKAHEHYRRSLEYSAAAAKHELFEPAILTALLAVAEAVQAAVMLQAAREIDNPHYWEQWRLLWQESAPKPEP